MKFKLESENTWFVSTDKKVDKLKKLGFTFDTVGRDVCLKSGEGLTIELKTINQLNNFVKEYGAVTIKKDNSIVL